MNDTTSAMIKRVRESDIIVSPSVSDVITVVNGRWSGFYYTAFYLLVRIIIKKRF